MGYALVIGYNPDQYSENNFTPKRWLAIDVQSSKKVSTRSTIASQPIQTGDTISDHMYRQAVTESISGSFGILHGDRTIGFVGDGTMGKQQYMFNGMSDRLQDVETEFEYIKNNGFLCELDTVDMDNVNSQFRFRQRKNMALQNITWTEHENTVDFDFEFYEVIFANSRQVLPIDKDKLSEYGLPDPNYTIGTSLAVELMDNTQGLVAFIAGMYEKGLITKEFLTNITKYRNDDISSKIALGQTLTFLGMGIEIAGGLTVGSAALTALAGATAVNPIIGLVAGLAIVIVGKIVELVGLVTKLVGEIQGEVATAPIFDVIEKTDKISDETLALWDEFIAKSKWLFLSFYDNCTVYKFSSDSTNQSMTINIGSSLWEISCIQNSSGERTFSAKKLTNLDSTTIVSTSNAFEQYSTKTYSTTTKAPAILLSELNFFKNGWFSDMTEGYEVFLFREGYGNREITDANQEQAIKEALIEFEKLYPYTYQEVLEDFNKQTTVKIKEIYFYNNCREFSNYYISVRNKKTNVLGDYRILVFKGDVQEEYDKLAHLIYDVISVGLKSES